MTILQGTMQDGTVLPVQVDAQGRLVAQLAASALIGPRNVIINGDLKINQRGVTIAAAANGAYGPDRWKKVNASNMTQIIEDVNYVPGVKYALSWKGGTPQVLTAPASGHWTLPNIPITATEIQLELGEISTPFERRSYGQELVLCQRYYEKSYNTETAPGTAASEGAWVGVNINATDFYDYGRCQFRVTKRSTPTLSLWSTNGIGGQFFNFSVGGNAGNSGVGLVGQNSFRFYSINSAMSPNQSGVASHWAASAEL